MFMHPKDMFVLKAKKVFAFLKVFYSVYRVQRYVIVKVFSHTRGAIQFSDARRVFLSTRSQRVYVIVVALDGTLKI